MGPAVGMLEAFHRLRRQLPRELTNHLCLHHQLLVLQSLQLRSAVPISEHLQIVAARDSSSIVSQLRTLYQRRLRVRTARQYILVAWAKSVFNLHLCKQM